MNFGNIITAFFIGVGFVSWPIVGKYSQAGGQWIITIVVGVTAIVVALLSLKGLNGLPTTKSLVLLATAGVINGLACYFYALKAADPQIPTSILAIIVSISMVISAPIIDWALNGTTFNLCQIVGFGTAIITIYLFGR